MTNTLRRFTGAMFLVALGSSVAAQTARQQSGAGQQTIEQTVRRLSDEWESVLMTRDVAVLRRIWSADFSYVDPTGRVFNKDQGIADATNHTDTYTAAKVTNFKVRVYAGGTVAVTTGDGEEIGHDKAGKAFDRKSRFTNVWVLQNGNWQCVSGHSSNLPGK